MNLRDQLLVLFQIDHEMHRLQERLNGARQRANNERAKQNDLLERQQQLEQKLHQAKATIRSNEQQLAELDRQMQERRQHMNEARTDKHYKAFAMEIESLKANRQQLEQASVDDISTHDALEQQVVHLQQDLKQQHAAVDAAEQRLSEIDEACVSRLEQLQSERSVAAQQVPREAFAAYERLFETSDGEPLAEIEEQDRRALDYTCTGCCMQVPAERVNQVLTRSELVHCPVCSRILYVSSKLHAALTNR